MAKRDSGAPAKVTAKDKEIFKTLLSTPICGGVKRIPLPPEKKSGGAKKK